jgi:ferritin-like metal-binding protein YciE
MEEGRAGGASGARHGRPGNRSKGVRVADLNARDAKLIQYLNEAYGKERQLETALRAHIAMTSRSTYKKRLQQHLQETKEHARGVGRRIKELGGRAEPVAVPGPAVVTETAARVQGAAQRAAAMAQGPLHAVRGTGEAEKLLKNAKTEFSNEAEEIATYTAIESLANGVGDRDTARLARDIRRQEERMASFLEKLIPTLTKAVIQAEIPSSQRDGAAGRRRSTASRRRRATASTQRRSTTSRRRRSGASASSRGAGTSSARRSGASARRSSSGRRRTRRAGAGTTRAGAGAQARS